MTTRARPAIAVGALASILAITASWWALALWPMADTAPAWLLRTRDVCFGAAPDGLPNAGGWVLLIGQPIGMLATLGVVWRQDLRIGLSLILARTSGQLLAGAVAAALIAGLASVAVRVAGVGRETFSAGTTRDLAASLTRIDDSPPAMALIDQYGQTVSVETFRGRPLLITFAFGHCETICPLVVADVLEAAARFIDEPPAVVIVTLDPWRDTPSRLSSLAASWRLTGDARILSGDPEAVERTLNSWRIPRVRNERTGDLSHPALVYILGRDGRITYAVPGGADLIAAAVRAL